MSERQSSGWSTEITELYENLGRELWAIFYAHCNDADRAYDALQEAFLKLHIHQGEPIRETRAWLLRVGKNWLTDVSRRRQSSEKHAEYLDELDSQKEGPAELMERSELQEQVRKGLDELNEEQRQILILRYALNWSSIKIAETLELKTSTVDMRLSRARKRLATILKRAGMEP